MSSKSKSKSKRHKALRSEKQKLFKQKARSSRKPEARKKGIQAEFMPNRTLKRSARKALTKRLDKRLYNAPWARDIMFKFRPDKYPKAHLLGIPIEVRQQILRHTIDEEQLHDMTGVELGQYVGNLAAVAPRMRIDLTYVAAQWTKSKCTQLADDRAAQARQQARVLAELRQGIEKYWYEDYRAWDRRAGVQVRTKRKKRKPRPRKCWYCNVRHYGIDPICPPSRGNTEEWLNMTKPLSRRKMANRTKEKDKRFWGTKTYFDD
ncbi:hypothetical protein EJ04DRAFT_570387 [Polyplosphaeria fusca]|uniref:Uncharacterized protein n=1 Tax=Polyplosphaeria fusca TaxID=682080 RepID=A0A9P4QJG9_9PLEO|nr:hypothetical protein EJ04DRAFT_570387 [Polyplosphaeria fusca]